MFNSVYYITILIVYYYTYIILLYLYYITILITAGQVVHFHLLSYKCVLVNNVYIIYLVYFIYEYLKQCKI